MNMDTSQRRACYSTIVLLFGYNISLPLQDLNKVGPVAPGQFGLERSDLL